MATTCKLIAKNVLGSNATEVTFSSIPTTFDDLLMVASQRNSVSLYGMSIRFNGDAGANYTYKVLWMAGSSVRSFSSSNNFNTYLYAVTNSSLHTANTFGNTTLYIPNYAGSTNKSCSIESCYENNSSNGRLSATAGLWSNTAAITSISIFTDFDGTSGSTGDSVSGSSFSLYGIKH